MCNPPVSKAQPSGWRVSKSRRLNGGKYGGAEEVTVGSSTVGIAVVLRLAASPVAAVPQKCCYQIYYWLRLSAR